MDSTIKKIWIEAEEWADGTWDYDDDNTDVVVEKDGKKYVASFFTYKNVESLTRKNRKTGENLSGKYFWGSDMILIDSCSRADIEKVIDDLIKDGLFESVFDLI